MKFLYVPFLMILRGTADRKQTPTGEKDVSRRQTTGVTLGW